MELHASRLRARTGSDDEPVLLLDQDRTRWDRLLIQRGLGMRDYHLLSAVAGDLLGRSGAHERLASTSSVPPR